MKQRRREKEMVEGVNRLLDQSKSLAEAKATEATASAASNSVDSVRYFHNESGILIRG